MRNQATQGEEFRADCSQRKFLPPGTLRRLTTLNPFRSSLAVTQTILTIAAAVGAGLVWWSPWVVVPAIVVIATQQHACFVLAHEAAHYRLYERRWLNDLIGRALAVASGVSMCSYRVVHRLHHNHLYGPEDPDVALHGGYPRGRAYLIRKLLKDVCGFTAPKTYAYFFGAPAINDDAGRAKRPLDDTTPALRRAGRRDRWLVVAFHIGAPAVAFAVGFGIEYLVLWVVPLLTVLQPILRFRAICEHGAVTDHASPLTAARTNFAPLWLRWVLFPHHVNYHVEHHLYPAIPHYNLPACHAELHRLGRLEGAEVRTLSQTARRVFADRPARQAA